MGMEALRRARKKAPGHVGNLLALVEACLGLHLWSEAAEIAESALGITKNPIERMRGVTLLAKAHAELPDERANAKHEALEAEKLVDAVAREHRSPLLRELSALFEKLGDAASSERALTRAVVFGGPASSAFSELSELYPVSTVEGGAAYAHALDEVVREAERLKCPSSPPGWRR